MASSRATPRTRSCGDRRTSSRSPGSRHCAVYRERFDHAPALQATIKRRIVLDRFVVDWEHVNGVPEGAFDAIATYEVVGGRIANVWTLRP